MGKATKWISLVGTGVFLFSVMAFPVWAATVKALDTYRQAVMLAMHPEGEILDHDRKTLDSKKVQLGLTDQEASRIEAEVDAAITSKAGRSD